MPGLRRAMYRVRQFAMAAKAELLPWQPPDLADHLSEAQLACFHRMPPTDQQHCYAVWQSLREDGITDCDLLVAALLHDAAKSLGGVGLFHRVVIVLVEAMMPQGLAFLAQDQPGSWRYPFYLYLHHAERGAALAQEAGSSELAVMLIRWHHERDGRPPNLELEWRLPILCAADEAN